jgi:hypothetical protein
MMTDNRILLLGTGSFAARILFDVCATARHPVAVTVAGRSPARLAWLQTAGHARANMFERPARICTEAADLSGAEAAAEIIARVRPKVVVQAASEQAGAVIAARGNAWAELVAEGGLSASAVFQALLTSRVAKGVVLAGSSAHVINCCYADVVNGIIAAQGLPVASGIGNVAIVANALAGAIGPDARKLRVLAHYQTITAFRRPAAERTGPLPRVWQDDAEIADVKGAFASILLTPEPVIDISGASGVPMLVAMAAGVPWTGHVPGPAGLPGGYPVRFDGARLALDLPRSITRDAAIAWNAGFERANGLVVENGRARYTGLLREKLAALSPDLAAGFEVDQLESVYRAMHELRRRLLETLAP